MLVEVNESYKPLDFGHIPRSWPVSDASNLDQVHLYATFWEYEAEVLNCGLFKGAFLHFEVEVVLMKDVKDLYYNLMMLFLCYIL